MRAMRRLLLLLLPALLFAPQANARTVYRCLRDGTVSLSTAPEPGSRCEKKTFQDDPGKAPNLWGALGVVKGNLYERQQDGKTVYGTRKLPGATKLMSFTVETPPGEPAHAGLGHVGKPRLDQFARQFRAASKKTGVDDAYLRAIAHAESGFDATAISPKGAVGVMQLMPATARDYGVIDPTSPEQSIDGGARMIRRLATRYSGNLRLVAAAYNAGAGVVTRYGGVPPYRETQEYIAKVEALYARYRAAMGMVPKSLEGHEQLRAAQ
ncbi:lytic transglycosylase domain-containing protein [Cognatilysobacter lacus]|uniref:Lytic transglycosylase domain-containing protein n=1 Tax=Cognatilysobacter lacus TaxID=1643323 RepID=A0A5D8YGR9_9GAMM|nr:lytic transglycosylase domain-containing protein [Lysobacter lacus]TZF81566.1 lytic transglycosylase domain-containing protein [Lysobacter lacus]